jgi:hypothetical protein
VSEEVQPERRERRDQEPSESYAAQPQEPRAADGVREVRRIFESSPTPPRWPMYIRQAKQFMRNVDSSFDERRFGFGSLNDLLRAAQREGVFRMERDRQGSVRLFPGPVLQSAAPASPTGGRPAEDDDNRGNVRLPNEPSSPWSDNGAEPVVVTAADGSPSDSWPAETQASESEVVEAAGVQEIDVAPVVDAEEIGQPDQADAAKPGRGRRGGRGGRTSARKPQEAVAQRPRKSPRPRSARSRKDAPQ